MRVAVIGNCQMASLAPCLQVMAPEIHFKQVVVMSGDQLSEPIDDYDLILLQTAHQKLAANESLIPEACRKKIHLWPTLYYSGFHPDIMYYYGKSGNLIPSLLGEYNSIITLFGKMKNLTVAQTCNLYTHPVFERLGYFEHRSISDENYLREGQKCGLDLTLLLQHWKTGGCFMYDPTHPRLDVISDIARSILIRLGMERTVDDPHRYINDPFQVIAACPVYPSIADRYGMTGSTRFKLPAKSTTPGLPAQFISLEEYVTKSFDLFADLPDDEFTIEAFGAIASRIEGLEGFVETRAAKTITSPYAGLPDSQFWRRAVAAVPFDKLDPVTEPKFIFRATDRIATSGSCFAQHIARTLVSKKLNYFVSEPAPADLSPDRALERGYGVFSARFGNVYTARQLLQLFDRAFGDFSPQDTAWLRNDGRFIDPFRPQIEPEGFATANNVAEECRTHLNAVREMFIATDVFIFTAGLTECWMSSADGAAYPICPAVVSNNVESSIYRFHNFETAEVREDLDLFVQKLRAVNPSIRVIFTVSPVPLVATYEHRHVLVSTTYSKSALRAATQEVAEKHDFVEYFPSYEIITGSFNKGSYFEDDLRSVKQIGVDHVMRTFIHNYAPFALSDTVSSSRAERSLKSAIEEQIAAGSKIICDENLLDS
ncbi:GSCFA domain-containing protein [Methylobacterium mesophilicum]